MVRQSFRSLNLRDEPRSKPTRWTYAEYARLLDLTRSGACFAWPLLLLAAAPLTAQTAPALNFDRSVALEDSAGPRRTPASATSMAMGTRTSCWPAGGVLMYTNRGDGTIAGPRPVGDPRDVAYSIAVADLDGDGRMDVVVGNDTTPGTILLNRGPGEGFDTIRFGDGEGAIYGLAVGDVNADGCPDIVAARSGAPSRLYVSSCGR